MHTYTSVYNVAAKPTPFVSTKEDSFAYKVELADGLHSTTMPDVWGDSPAACDL